MGSTTIQQPAAPQAPTQTSTMSDYIANYPRLVELQGQQAPIEAQQQLQMLQQYGLPIAEEYKAINEALYPETAALQEQMSGQAMTGMQQGLTDDELAMYRDRFASELGTNAGSPIGADYMSTSLMGANIGRKDYYRDLGLSLADRQPLAQGQAPSYNQVASGYTPQGALGFNASTYGTGAGIYGNQLSAYSAQQQQNSPYAYIMAGGNVLQGIGSMVPGV